MYIYTCMPVGLHVHIILYINIFTYMYIITEATDGSSSITVAVIGQYCLILFHIDCIGMRILYIMRDERERSKMYM